MVNYANGKIYKIVCDTTNKQYIGSTTLSLSKRLSKHKTSYTAFLKDGNILRKTMALDLFVNDNYKIILLEAYPCENKEQLLKKEREHIDKTVCVNKIMPFTTEEERLKKQKEYLDKYRMKNQNKLAEYYHTYEVNNQERIKERRANYYQNNKTEIRTKRKAFLQNNIEVQERRKEYRRAYYARNRDKILEQRRQHRIAKQGH